MEELGRIKTFVDVVEAGSFTAAARDRCSTSTAARQVRALEDELGIRLLNRNTRHLSLTGPGQIFYTRACEILADLNNAKSEIRSFSDEVRGSLKVCLRVAPAMTVIVPALPKFVAKYPDVIVDIVMTDDRIDLISNKIDLAVWLGNIPDSELISRKLRPTQRVVCGSPDYFAKHGVPESPADLINHNCLLYTARSYGSRWYFGKSDPDQAVDIKGNVRADNGAILMSAAMNGIGIFIAHEWMVTAALKEGKLVRVLSDYNVRPRKGDADLFLVYPSSRGLSRNVRAFADFLIELFRAA